MKSQRSCANRAMKVNATMVVTNVPAMRKAPLFKDCPVVARLIMATAKPAQYGFSQSIDNAIP
jgi:hypothetical protein